MINQGIDYLIVADLECNSGSKGFVLNEVIEFSFVIVDTKEKLIINEFQTFVKPTYHPKLTNFIVKFTGIEQIDVDNAPTIQEVQNIIPKDSISCFLFDCDSDAVYLRSEINLKKLTTHPYFLKYINIKDSFEKFYSIKANSVDNMMKHLKIVKSGHSHIALHDARNTSKVAISLLDKGHVFQMNSMKDIII